MSKSSTTSDDLLRNPHAGDVLLEGFLRITVNYSDSAFHCMSYRHALVNPPIKSEDEHEGLS
jgi:hypothetical protein